MAAVCAEVDLLADFVWAAGRCAVLSAGCDGDGVSAVAFCERTDPLPVAAGAEPLSVGLFCGASVVPDAMVVCVGFSLTTG